MNALVVVAACLATAAGTLGLLSALARLRFRRLPGAFRCRLARSSGDRRPGALRRVGRTYAVWVNDVLLIQSGALRLGVTPVAARVDRQAAVEALPASAARGLGPHAVALRLTGGDGRSLLVATTFRNRTTLAGPFLAACVPRRPPAPRGPLG